MHMGAYLEWVVSSLLTVGLRFTFSDTGTLPVLLCRTQQSGLGHEEGALYGSVCFPEAHSPTVHFTTS